MKIVVDDKIPFIRGVFEAAGAEAAYLPGARIARADLADADALVVRTRTRCDAGLLAGTPVRCVATATIGCDHLDAPWLEAEGIAWSNAPGCNAASVAGYLASVLVRLEHAGHLRLAGAVLGVIGVGQVGSRAARLGRLLGMKVLECDPPRRDAEGGAFVDAETVFREADVVTCHVPLTRAGLYPTEELVGEEAFGRMKPTAWFINTSRGEIVDETALKAALVRKRIAGTVLDVWRREPGIDRELLDLAWGATPHIAGYSADGKANGTAVSVRFVSRTLGLGLDDWRPLDIPAPRQPRIVLPAAEPLYHAVIQSYDFRRDDAALRRAPENFEKLRGDYPLRREFPAFTIVNPGAQRDFWQAMGFQLDV